MLPEEERVLFEAAVNAMNPGSEVCTTSAPPAPFLYEGVPYVSYDFNPSDDLSRVKRATRAVYEVWVTWAEDRGNRALLWAEATDRAALFSLILRYYESGRRVWEPFPNPSWHKYPELQALLEVVASKLLERDCGDCKNTLFLSSGAPCPYAREHWHKTFTAVR